MSGIGARNLDLHVALLPSSGMGHLTPFLRLAMSLVAEDVRVTFLTAFPAVSLAETLALSSFFTDFPQVVPRRFDLLPVAEDDRGTDDPFYHHFEVIRRSCHLLGPILSSASPPLSAIVTDMSLVSAVLPITEELVLPNYVFFTSSAKMFTLFASYHNLAESRSNSNPTTARPGFVNIPSRQQYVWNGFPGSLEELNNPTMFPGFPPLFAVGPLPPVHSKDCQALTWLDEQEPASVMYVSFGSRTAISKEQLKELGSGLVKCGCRILWTVKNKKIDDEDKENIDELLGCELAKSVRSRGLLVKEWVDQSLILGHNSIGGFLTHCGWNSVTEAAWHGVPLLAWPQHGDQKINARVGMWDESWDWGESTTVPGEEIAKRIWDVLGNNGLELRAQMSRIKESARRAMGSDGRSVGGLSALIDTWKWHRDPQPCQAARDFFETTSNDIPFDSSRSCRSVGPKMIPGGKTPPLGKLPR